MNICIKFILYTIIFRNDAFCPEYDEIYRGKEYFAKLEELKNDQTSLEEVIEKICIVSHLIDKEIIHYFDNGHNPLKLLLGGKFNKYSDDQVIKTFRKINSLYQQELQKLFFDDLQNISKSPTIGRTFAVERKIYNIK
jgi:hypothetical protein